MATTSGKIIAHIVGLPNSMKEKFMEAFNTHFANKNITLIDLDNITMNVIKDDTIIKLYEKLDKLLNSKNVAKETKALEIKINDYWKAKIDNYLLKELSKGKNVICIGLSTYFKNHKVGIKLVTPLKLFYKIDPKENARNIIKENLKKYEKDILNGSFNLEYLDLNFLIKKREHLQNIYYKMGYQAKKYSDILNIVRIGAHQYLPDHLFFISQTKLTKAEINKRKITAYTIDWLAIASIFKKDVERGYKFTGTGNSKKKIPFIKELKKGVLEKHNDPIYIYATTDVESFMPELTKTGDIYKYIATKPIKNLNHLYIENPLEQLKKINVKVIV